MKAYTAVEWDWFARLTGRPTQDLLAEFKDAGLGSLPGVVLGGLLIGMVEVFSGYFLAPSLTQVVYFAVFLLMLMVRPAGLLGQRGAEELGTR